MHPVEKAALDAGFIDAKPATAHPFDFWRKKLDSLPLSQYIKIDHRPRELTGWDVNETTIWSAAYPTPPFEKFPEAYGEVCGYYIGTQRALPVAFAWMRAVRELGFEARFGLALPDRAAAARAGLGVAGLSGPLLTPRGGSFVYLATLAVRMPPPKGTPGPEADAPETCEKCGLCQNACPTGAIGENGVDATRCLRFDMGHPELTPDEHFVLMGRRIVGCDQCQRACPKNRGIARVKPSAAQLEPFLLDSLLDQPNRAAVADLIGENYARAGRLRTQAAYASANSRRTDLAPLLERLTADGYAPLRRAARWALGRLKNA